MNGIPVDIGTKVTEGGFFGYTCIESLVSNIVSMVFIVSGIVFFVFLVWGGFDILTSGGDKTRLADGQKRLTSALIGLAIVSTSYAIYKVVLIFFGIDLSKICTDNPVG